VTASEPKYITAFNDTFTQDDIEFFEDQNYTISFVNNTECSLDGVSTGCHSDTHNCVLAFND